MDSRIGLDYIVENPDYTKKLAAALDTTNISVKKQVFELLAALCVYNVEGYQRSLETLEHYKANKCERYRFKVIVDELRHSKDVDFLSTIVAFVNCTIISAKSLKDRNRLRNEYIGLKILDVVAKLRATFSDSSDSELFVQLDIFDEQRYADDCQSAGPNGVDLNSHQDVFYAILRQVTDTPQEIPFLSILQHLLRIDSTLPISDIIWDTAEKLVHRATLCETKEDSEKLLRTPSYHHSLNKLLRGLQETGGRCQCSCHTNGEGSCNSTDGRTRKRTPLQLNFGNADGSRTTGILSPTNSSLAFSPELLATLSRAISPPPKIPGVSPLLPTTGNSSGPPPPSNPQGPPPPPPPPPPIPGPGGAPPPPPPPPLPGGSPPPPPPPPGTVLALPLKIASPIPEAQLIKLPQQSTPKPKNKMKSLNWTKIPSNKVVGRNNLWSMIAKVHDGSPNNLDFGTIEDLFCQQSTSNGSASPRLGNLGERNGKDSLDRKKRESSEINLLDGKRSLNVNIFLKQFRSSNEEIITILKRGTHDEIGAEKLRGLLKVLPESDEVEMLRGYNGDRHRLGNAEKFLLQLIELPNYKIRCEGMLLKEEFASNMAFLEPAIETIESAVHELKHCKELHEVLYMLLVAGNFLNSGGYAGDAAGFKMMSLLKMAETRANKPGMNLIHYVAQEAESKFPALLKFPDILSNLEEASKLSIDNLKTEINNLANRVSKISQQVFTAGDDVKQQMEEFINFAKRETAAVQKEIDGLEKVRADMADFLCEELQSFKLEECFKIFQSFCQKFKAAIEENEKRRLQEKRAEARRKQREEQLALKKKNSGENRPPSFSGSESDNIIDMLLGDIKSGFHRYVDSGSLKSTRGSGKAKRSSPDGSATPVELCRMNSLTSSVPSEEDPTASPRVIRRRIGSSNSAVNGYGGDTDGIDTQSPDITPNGTLRRRRNRLSSEDRDESLIDFLRQEGKTPDCESLDRSWIRRSSRRRRPELIAAELNDRERPASPGPSPLLERRAITIDPEANKPKQWRLKIEEWLQENEKEQEREKKLKEKIALERWKRQEMEQREADLSSASITASEELKNQTKNLSTLHEVKTDSELYSNKSKHYSLNSKNKKTPEVAEGMPLKDKSKWRKSTLNVANSSESIDDERRRSRSRKQKSDPECDDTISFYMRSPDRQDTDKYSAVSAMEQSISSNEVNTSQSILPNLVTEQNSKSNRSDVLETHARPSDLILSSKDDEKEQIKPLTELSKANTDGNNEKIETVLAPNNAELSIGRSRFYQSMKEPSLKKVDQTLNKSSTLDNQDFRAPSQLTPPEKHFIDEPKTSENSKINSPEIDDEGNFDRFSFMRKTTRRTKPRQKVPDVDTKEQEELKVITGRETNETTASRIQRNKTPSSIAPDAESIAQENEESQNFKENPIVKGDKNKMSGNLFTKNVIDNGKSYENPEDIKRKDKSSTSLKARLSKRLLSLTENLKVTKPTESSDSNSTTSTPAPKSALEGKFALMQDSPCPRIEKVLQERRASLIKEEKPNPPIMEHREKVLSRPKQDITQVSQRKIQDEYKPIMAEPKLLKENFLADMNNVKIAHATPVTHNVKIIYSYPSQTKGKEESEKDEGFEETQSQLSEAASQGAGSNYDTDLADSPRSVRQTKNKNNEASIDKDIPILPELRSKHVENKDIEKRTKILDSSNKEKERKNNLSNAYNSNTKIPHTPQTLKHTSLTTVKMPQRSASLRKTVSKTPSTSADKSGLKQSTVHTPSITRKASIPKSEKNNNIRRNSEESISSNIKSHNNKSHKNNKNDASPKIGRRVAEYTKAIKSMTNSLRGTKRQENYDVTQSMPPTPSDEHKTFMSGLVKAEIPKKTRSTSSVCSSRSQNRRLSEKSLLSTYNPPSRRGSDKSLSRKSSDRSLNLSRKSSETSVVTVRSVNRRRSPARSKLAPTISPTAIRNKINTKVSPTTNKIKPVQPKISVQTKQVPGSNKPIVRSASTAKQSTTTRPITTVRRTSSDRSCGFMKATSASSAKTAVSKSAQEHKNQKISLKPSTLAKVESPGKPKI